MYYLWKWHIHDNISTYVDGKRNNINIIIPRSSQDSHELALISPLFVLNACIVEQAGHMSFVSAPLPPLCKCLGLFTAGCVCCRCCLDSILCFLLSLLPLMDLYILTIMTLSQTTKKSPGLGSYSFPCDRSWISEYGIFLFSIYGVIAIDGLPLKTTSPSLSGRSARCRPWTSYNGSTSLLNIACKHLAPLLDCIELRFYQLHFLCQSVHILVRVLSATKPWPSTLVPCQPPLLVPPSSCAPYSPVSYIILLGCSAWFSFRHCCWPACLLSLPSLLLHSHWRASFS